MKIAAVFKEYDQKDSIKLPKKNTRKKMSKRANFPIYIEEFGEFLFQLNYSDTTIQSHKERGRKFCNVIEQIGNFKLTSMPNFKLLSKEHVYKYEQYLNERIRNNQLKPYSAYCDMKTVRLFLKFLLTKNIIPFKYEIPKYMIVPCKRSNLYVESETILKLADSIMTNQSTFGKHRNLAFLLLLVETGCRLVEACSLLVTDISFTEKTIRLTSIKSGTRKLVLNDFVVLALKQYFDERKKLNSSSDYFFLKYDGTKTNWQYLSRSLSIENNKAFGYSKVNSRSLRHTYITNAIDNNNDFVQVSKSIGHKHWVSTMYYLHRDKKRLLNNTLPYNPIPKLLISEGEDNGNKRS